MSRRRWTRPTLTSARDWGSHGRRDNDEQRAAGVSTATRGAVHPGQLAAGAAPGRAQRRGAHESVSLREALQAQHRRASASIPRPTQDRRGAGVAGGPDGADRRDRAVGGLSDAESLHDDVSASHRDDAERVPQRRDPPMTFPVVFPLVLGLFLLVVLVFVVELRILGYAYRKPRSITMFGRTDVVPAVQEEGRTIIAINLGTSPARPRLGSSIGEGDGPWLQRAPRSSRS